MDKLACLNWGTITKFNFMVMHPMLGDMFLGMDWQDIWQCVYNEIGKKLFINHTGRGSYNIVDATNNYGVVVEFHFSGLCVDTIRYKNIIDTRISASDVFRNGIWSKYKYAGYVMKFNGRDELSLVAESDLNDNYLRLEEFGKYSGYINRHIASEYPDESDWWVQEVLKTKNKICQFMAPDFGGMKRAEETKKRNDLLDSIVEIEITSLDNAKEFIRCNNRKLYNLRCYLNEPYKIDEERDKKYTELQKEWSYLAEKVRKVSGMYEPLHEGWLKQLDNGRIVLNITENKKTYDITKIIRWSRKAGRWVEFSDKDKYTYDFLSFRGRKNDDIMPLKLWGISGEVDPPDIIDRGFLIPHWESDVIFRVMTNVNSNTERWEKDVKHIGIVYKTIKCGVGISEDKNYNTAKAMLRNVDFKYYDKQLVDVLSRLDELREHWNDGDKIRNSADYQRVLTKYTRCIEIYKYAELILAKYNVLSNALYKLY